MDINCCSLTSGFLTVCLFSPPAFREWTSPSFGLCSKELFGGARKFFLTLYCISMCRTRSELFDFTLSDLFDPQCDDGLNKQSILGVVYTPSEPKKEGRHR